MIELESSSPEETERIAAGLASALRPGDLVTVAGDLGAGKTTFVRGACRELGVAEPVTSPTYTVGHRYGGRVPVSHVDLYRFEHDLSEDDWGDLEGYFEGAVVFVEWPERAQRYLGAAGVAVRLRLLESERRLIGVETTEKSLEIALSSRC
ncbi:MAG: tRNA (adenosine(37)-N6)-threonylcarbamoyltransferase complex ATPase subunit type 1 TsaE [Gaiellaceae bacterium]